MLGVARALPFQSNLPLADTSNHSSSHTALELSSETRKYPLSSCLSYHQLSSTLKPYILKFSTMAKKKD